MRLAAVTLLASLGVSAQTITFTKSFPGSTPPYASVSVTKNGALEYKESPTDEQPVTATLPEKDATPLSDMDSTLEYFRIQLESGLKVANTGKKSFRYDDGSGKISEANFNYSTNQVAQQLLDKFEQIAATERAYLDLEKTSRFDKLGVNDALAEIESLWLRKQLAAPLQFVPLLKQISSHESYMHVVRERAARLKGAFELPGPSAQAGKPTE